MFQSYPKLCFCDKRKNLKLVISVEGKLQNNPLLSDFGRFFFHVFVNVGYYSVYLQPSLILCDRWHLKMPNDLNADGRQDTPQLARYACPHKMNLANRRILIISLPNQLFYLKVGEEISFNPLCLKQCHRCQQLIFSSDECECYTSISWQSYMSSFQFDFQQEWR